MVIMLEDERVRVRLIASTVAYRDGLIQTGYESAGGVIGWEILEKVSFEDLGERAANLSLKMLDANPAPPGRILVVMSAEAGGTMIHEACGHRLGSRIWCKKVYRFIKNKIGEKVAADEVTVIDDATIGHKYGTYRFDDEGTAGQRTVFN